MKMPHNKLKTGPRIEPRVRSRGKRNGSTRFEPIPMWVWATSDWEGGDTIVASNGDVWTEIQFNTEDLYREFPLPSTRH